jgi:hypothetical protein
MKVLLVFLALMMLNLTFISYKGDLNRYLQLRTFLKAVAEESAGGAALYYDEEAFGFGNMIIKDRDAELFVDSLVMRAGQLLSLEDGESLDYEMVILDDRDGGAARGLSPTVEVILTLTSRDLFRLPFLTVEQVSRAAKYELADSNAQCYNEIQ